MGFQPSPFAILDSELRTSINVNTMGEVLDGLGSGVLGISLGVDYLLKTLLPQCHTSFFWIL